jgi:hypothetical protein
MTAASPESGLPPTQGVNDSLAWVVALLPILGAAAGYGTGRDLWLLVLVLNITLCGLDYSRLQQAGHNVPVAWIFLIPVYLWKRAKSLNSAPVHFYVWLIAFAGSIAAPSLLAPGIDKATACELVTQILHDQDSTAAVCKGITIVQDPGTGFVKASALLSDGTELPLTIEMTGDSIKFQILRQKGGRLSAVTPPAAPAPPASPQGKKTGTRPGRARSGRTRS